jgi:hypothetical protein
VIQPADDGHSVKRVTHATEVNHDKTGRKEKNNRAEIEKMKGGEDGGGS